MSNGALHAACAFLNGLGGSSKGELMGQQVTNKTFEEIAIELRRIEPPAFPEIETIAVEDDKKVILIRVPGERGTYTYDGRPYLRHGPTTQIMPRGEYEQRLLERMHPTHRWESQPVPEGITIKDLDEEEIHNTLRSAIQQGRMKKPPHGDTESILLSLELIKEGKLLNAALALYGKSDNIHILYPQLSIRLARFRGNNRLTSFLDNRAYWGNAFELLRRGELFLLDYVPIAGRVVSGKMIREDYPLYPPLATREAIVNAICHRDYSEHGGAIAIAMYDDHLEVINPGSFHFGVTPVSLTLPHASRPWNPLIANVFYRAGVIERWGMGTLSIIQRCHENQNPPPVWEEQTGAVVLTIYPSNFFFDEVREENIKDLVAGQDRILEFCKQPRKAKEIMQLLGLKHRELFYKNYLKPLLKKELLLMTLPDTPTSRNQSYFANPKFIQKQSNSVSKPQRPAFVFRRGVF